LKKDLSDLRVECDLQTDLPLQAAELKLIQALLPELLKDILWLQEVEE
jgi:hypothetical protein